MVRLLGEVFSRYDPPAAAAGLTSAEFEAFVRLLCPKAAAEGLTIVARLAGTGERRRAADGGLGVGDAWWESPPER